MRRGLGIAFGVLCVGALLYAATLSQAGFECEACVAFGGRQSCRAVVGPSLEEARRAAVSNACAVLTRGVTETVRCEGQTPLRMTCQER